MLYLDYSRKDGQWLPNKYGGRENLEAVQLLKEATSRLIETIQNYDDCRRIHCLVWRFTGY